MNKIGNISKFGLGISLALTGMLPTNSATAARQNEKKHLLVVSVTKEFRHDSIPLAEETIQALGEKTGEWDTDFVRTDEEMQSKMTKASLEKYDGIIFANTTGTLPLPEPQAFLDYVKSGHGFAALHSGADTMHQFPGSKASPSEYIQLLGAEFLTHHSQCAVNAHILDNSFPGVKALRKAAKGASHGKLTDDARNGSILVDKTWRGFDEIYLMKNVYRDKLHVILSLDAHPNDGSPEANQPGEYLISWTKAYGKGRVFYISLGHRQEMWHDPSYQAYLTGGLEFTLGLKRGSTKPNPSMTKP